jgi:hypothetical protein
MIDPRRERPIRMADVPKEVQWLPRRGDGRRIHLSTLYRWEQRGLRGVRLETIQLGGTRCTSEAALLRFFEALGQVTAAAGRAAEPTPARGRRPGFEQAERLLDDAGI